MAAIDELLEIIKIQQKTIETLTAKLEEKQKRKEEKCCAYSGWFRGFNVWYGYYVECSKSA